MKERFNTEMYLNIYKKFTAKTEISLKAWKLNTHIHAHTCN